MQPLTTADAQDRELRAHETRAAAATRRDARSQSLRADHLEVWGQLKQLKPWTAASMAAVVVLVALLASWHWQLLLASILLFGPTLGVLVHWWQRHPEYCPLDHVLSSYAYGLFVLGVVAMGSAFVLANLAAYLILLLPILIVFTYSRAAAAYYILIGLFELVRWTAFCLVEEIWLVAALRSAKKRRAHRVGGEGSARANKAYQLYATASAIGYSTAQCVALTCLVTAIMEGRTSFETTDERRHQANNVDDDGITEHETFALLGLALCFTWFWLPLRLVASHLNVLELARNPDAPNDPNTFFPLGADAARSADDDAVTAVPPATTGCAALRCGPRWRHLVDIIRWSWGLRSAHLFQFFLWLFVFAEPARFDASGLVAWLVMTFLCWLVILAVAWWRVRRVEAEIEPSAQADAGAANLRALYGFSLLDANGTNGTTGGLAPADDDIDFDDDGRDDAALAGGGLDKPDAGVRASGGAEREVPLV